MLFSILPALLVLLYAWRSAVKDARRLRSGFALVIGALMLSSVLLEVIFSLLDPIKVPMKTEVYFFIGMFGLILLTVVFLIGALLINGIVMLQRERRSLANMLSLLVGILLAALLVLAVLTATTQSVTGLFILFFGGFPIVLVAFSFTTFLIWSWVYARIARKRASTADAVIVLGSGLKGDTVPPLLAGRIRHGVKVLQRARTSNPVAPIVFSGGKGNDETRAEGVAMEAYAREQYPDLDGTIVEDKSRTTEQNLKFTRVILESRGVTGKVAVVTSDYHAFRAATLMRRLEIDGDALGAPTAVYYRPSASLREFLAVARDHFVLSAVLFGLSLVPALVALWFTVMRMIEGT
ncbi:YdcF family protein [Humidisolicoccus flavus]|uniref:YdcF family protein n=1 Tax=Humidisolicoccus flavus TaxID=3111414 RepID=UPI00324EF8C3